MSSAAPKPRLNSVFKQLMSIHWWMASCYLILLASGQIMEKLEGEASFRELLFSAHKSFGVLVLLLLVWRLYLLVRVWGRKYSKHLPKFTGNWYFKTALHTVLYVMMFVVPISGYWLTNAYNAHNISLFGIPMPDIFPVNSEVAGQASGVHSRTSKVFAVLIFIHFICQHKVVKANWRRFLAWLQRVKSA
jgi:cytochrome b561